MKIFLSHRSRDKTLVREFRSLLPRFLDTWLDEDSLSWGDSFPAELRSSIQSGVDFLIIFLDNDAFGSEWVKQEVSNGNKILRLFWPTCKESWKIAKRSEAIDTAPKHERLVEQSRMG